MSTTASVSSLTHGDINGDGVYDYIMSGANDGNVATVATLLGGTRDGISPLLAFSLKTKSDALQSMGMLDRTLTNLTQQRGVIGAFQSRLNVASNVIQGTRDNYKAAESQIRDIDVAEATATFARSQILQQSAVAVLAQANQLPQLVLKLLKSS